MNEPLLKRVARTSRLTTNLARDVEALARGIGALDPTDLEPLEAIRKSWLTTTQALSIANRHWLGLINQIDALEARARDISLTAGDVASYATDTVQIMTQMDELNKAAYIAWARYTMALMPILLGVAVKEVASHEGGGRQLELLRDAINEVLSPEEGHRGNERLFRPG